MVLVHGLLVIPDSRRFLSVEVTRWVDPCTMGESRLTGGVEISHRVVRRQVNRHGESHDTSPKISDLKEMVQAYKLTANRALPIFCFVSLFRFLEGITILFSIDYLTEKEITSNLSIFFLASPSALP